MTPGVTSLHSIPAAAPQTAARSQPSAAAANWAHDDMDVEKGTLGGYGQPASEDLTFGDLLDLINPLQHIPGVSHVYRALTGDTIKPAVKIAGGMLFGGPVGILIGAGGAVVDKMLGDPMAQMADAVLGTDSADHAIASAARVSGPAATSMQVAELPSQQPSAPPSLAEGAGIGETSQAPLEIGTAAEAQLAALMAASASQASQAQAPRPPAPASVPSGATEAASRSTSGAVAGPVTAPSAAQNGFELAAYNGAAARPTAGRSGGGKDIRTYFAEAMPRAAVVRRPAEPAAPEKNAGDAVAIPAASGAPSVGPRPPVDQATKPATVPRADDIAASANRIATDRIAPPTIQPAQHQVPPWFADRVLENLDRYGSGVKAPSRSRADGTAASG